MSNRVLLVDDDQSLVSSISRNLCLDYDIATAASGAEALEVIQASGPFGVVLTDMRMPGLSGLQLIIEARKLAPLTSYIMLTGNQDLATAVQAVNEGHVFRFLSKPCELVTIRAAIEGGLRQHGLELAEKDLLNKTCAGAVSMLTDILEATKPEICSRLGSLSQVVDQLLTHSRIPKRWDYALASRLALVGFACLDEEAAKSYEQASPHTDEWRFAVERAVGIGGRMVRRIPRLECVGEIIESCHDVTGCYCYTNPKSNAAIVRNGSTVIALAMAWDALRRQGLKQRDAILELQQLFDELSTDYVEAFEKFPVSRAVEEQVGVKVALRDLTPGMVLQADAQGRDGSVLLRAGSRLSEAHIEKLRHGTEHVGGTRPIMIVESTAGTAAVV